MKRTTIFLIALLFSFATISYSATPPQNIAAKNSQEIGENNVWQEWIFPAVSIVMLAVGLTVVGLNQGSPPDTSSTSQ